MIGKGYNLIFRGGDTYVVKNILHVALKTTLLQIVVWTECDNSLVVNFGFDGGVQGSLFPYENFTSVTVNAKETAAVVPAIAEFVGRCIVAAEKDVAQVTRTLGFMGLWKEIERVKNEPNDHGLQSDGSLTAPMQSIVIGQTYRTPFKDSGLVRVTGIRPPEGYFTEIAVVEFIEDHPHGYRKGDTGMYFSRELRATHCIDKRKRDELILAAGCHARSL